MSRPCLEVTEGLKEKQESPDVDVQQIDNVGKSTTEESPQVILTKESQIREKTDTGHTSNKSSNSVEPSDKVLNKRLSGSSTPSDLSTGHSRRDGIPISETCSDNISVITHHYNSLAEKGLSYRNQSRIVYMRNFNNWIKSMLIKEYTTKLQDKNHGASMRALDIGCGKGGDLFKWQKCNITHLICADIADLSVEQCQHRYNDMVNKNSNERGFVPAIFSAEFIKGDCTKIRLKEKFKDVSMQLDITSCQFAFHYCFESLPQAECMLKNASETLRPGGYFIGTIPDSYDLVARWRECDGNKYGNDVFSVEFLCDDKLTPPLFGAKYNFHLDGVVNCPEFLVHLPTLCKLALKFGLKLIMFERFHSYYERMKNEGRSLLSKMQAFETYPPYHETPLLGQDGQDYQHAVQYMQNLPDHRKIGTLSQSEWEVTSLYAVFAFQKMKTIM